MIAALKGKGVSAIGAGEFCRGGKWFAFNFDFGRELNAWILWKYFLHCNPTVLQLLTSSLLACVTGTVAMKLASSTDLQNVVLLHPSSITEYHIDSKSPTFQAHTKYLLQIACCLRCWSSLFQMFRFQLLYWELRMTICPHQKNWNSLKRSC